MPKGKYTAADIAEPLKGQQGKYSAADIAEPAEQSSASGFTPPSFPSITAGDIGTGISEGAATTTGNLVSLTSKLLNKIPGIGETLAPKQGIDSLDARIDDVTTPHNVGEKIGKIGEQGAEFFLPAGEVSKGVEAAELATKGMKGAKIFNLGARMGLEGASTAGMSAIHGDSPDEVKNAGLIGAATPVLGKAVESAADTIPKSIYTRLIRPGTSEFTLNEAQSAGKALSDISPFATSKRDLLQKTLAARSGVGKDIGGVLDAATNAGKKIDVSPSISIIDEAMQKADQQGNAALHSQLSDLRDSMTRVYENGQPTTALKPLNIQTPNEAAELKRGLQQKINFTLPNANYLNDTRKGVAGTIGNAIDNAVQDIQPLNDQYSGLSKARVALKRASAAEERNSPISLYDALAMLSMGSTAGAAEGPLSGVGAGLLTGAITKAARSVPGQTAAANLFKLGPKAAVPAKLLRNFYLAGQ